MAEPRWLDVESAAAYLSLRVDVFLRRVRAGGLPKPSDHLGERTPRWDRDKLDALMSGTSAVSPTTEAVHVAAQKILTRRSRRPAHAR